MKIVLISDTHGQHQDLKIPSGDLLIHAGDISKMGYPKQVKKFVDWFSELPFKHKVFIGGNHDYMLEREPEKFETYLNDSIIYLNDSQVEIDGLKIWGSPISPWFYDWAFNRKRGKDIRQHWDLIPSDTDVLITHGPPKGQLDQTVKGEDVGCFDLLEKVLEVKPKLHVFGHIHEAYGQHEYEGIQFINASVLDFNYQLVNKPIVMEL